MTSKKQRLPEGNRLQFKRYKRQIEQVNLVQDGDDRLLILVNNKDTLRCFNNNSEYKLVNNIVKINKVNLADFGKVDTAFFAGLFSDIVPVYLLKP